MDRGAWRATVVLDPAHEFEKVPVKEESKVGKVPVNISSESSIGCRKLTEC